MRFFLSSFPSVFDHEKDSPFPPVRHGGACDGLRQQRGGPRGGQHQRRLPSSCLCAVSAAVLLWRSLSAAVLLLLPALPPCEPAAPLPCAPPASALHRAASRAQWASPRAAPRTGAPPLSFSETGRADAARCLPCGIISLPAFARGGIDVVPADAHRPRARAVHRGPVAPLPPAPFPLRRSRRSARRSRLARAPD